MSQIAVSLKNISKKFRLFESPKDRLKEALHPFKKKYHKEFWALKDISFDVPKGKTLGIIGRNGSGKSALLQIICGVLQPTTGSVTVNGRISALLELGADFSPEFTGRENVLMKGIRTGLSKAEMIERLPEIEAFADIGEFINYPLKTYSSGMFVRLAFATAINIDPEVLIVDEALAVGDVKFQYKCYQKFIEFQKAGKTIIFVTHDIQAVLKHCDKAILLENGSAIDYGNPVTVTTYYVDLLFSGKISEYADMPDLLVEGYKDFNIVHFKWNYFAISCSLGEIDFMKEDIDSLSERYGGEKFIVAKSVDEVKEIVNGLVPGDAVVDLERGLSSQERPVISGLAEFIKDEGRNESCHTRASYNKNEYRHGDGRARIIDYMIVADRMCDVSQILWGIEVEIYIKTVFFSDIQIPLFGLGIYTLDGIRVYGINTQSNNVTVRPMRQREMLVMKFSFQWMLNRGDYFINFGVVEVLAHEQKYLDSRRGVAHVIAIDEKSYSCDGIVNFECRIEEVCPKVCRKVGQ